MKTISKALVGTIAAGAMAVASASPAYARSGDGIGAGEVIAGALIIGGIAAIAASASHGKDRDSYDYGGRNGYNGRYGRDDSRSAVDMCVRTAENTASRNAYGRAKVTDVRQINRKRDGYDVKGRIAVNNMGRAWRSGDPRYGRGWNDDYRGWNSDYRGYDAGSFTCKVRYGRVVDVDFKNIRGL
jgi:hypothetical protein